MAHMRYLLAALMIASGCSGPSTANTSDMGADSGPFVPADAGSDAGQDTGVDSGAACECSSGPCCDGCHLRPATYACSVVITSGCTGNSLCQGRGRVAEVGTDTVYCTGLSESCAATAITTITTTDCRVPDGVNYLTYGRCDPTGVAHCVDGPDCASTFP